MGDEVEVGLDEAAAGSAVELEAREAQRAGGSLVRVDGGGRDDAKVAAEPYPERHGVGEVLRQVHHDVDDANRLPQHGANHIRNR